MSEPPTSEPGFSSLLPTPTAQTGGDGERSDGFRRLLAPEIRRTLLPTPCSQEPGGTPERFLERKNRADNGNRTMENGNLSLTHTVALLPTPTGDDANNVTRESGEFQSLARTAHALLPTPRTRDHHAQGVEASDRRQGVWGADLPSEVRRLLPTPTRQDGANTAGPSQHERNTPPPNVAASKFLPTPNVQNSHESGTPRDHRADMTAALRGAFTPTPSTDGNTSSDDPPPGQLTIEDV